MSTDDTWPPVWSDARAVRRVVAERRDGDTMHVYDEETLWLMLGTLVDALKRTEEDCYRIQAARRRDLRRLKDLDFLKATIDDLKRKTS
jgi:hypothetical protein